MRHAHPAHRVARSPGVTAVLEASAFVEDGVHVARRDAVDADTVACPFGGQTMSKMFDASLGDVVC